MKLKDYFLRIFFPLKCPLCGELIPLTERSCRCSGGEAVFISDNFCRSCGAEIEKCTCNNKDEIHLDNIAGVYIYDGIVRSQIALFKFAKEKSFAKEFSLLMSERVAKAFCDVEFDLVTFVPSSELTLEERGFNQSELLAKGVAERLFLPLQDTLIKIKETKKQHSLSARERVTNLDGAFSVKENANLKNKTILLCDDIKTTGSTLKECSDVLYENGAKAVYCIVLAVTDYLTDF